MTDSAFHARVLVIDLTSSIGLGALRSLLPNPDGAGPWLGLRLAGLPAAPRLDWHPVRGSEPLVFPGPTPVGVYVIVGPGAAQRMPEVLAAATGQGAGEVAFLMTPTALMESIALDRLLKPVEPSERPLVLQLPTSDAQALWMILLEQIDNQLRRTNAGAATDPSDREGEPMTSNLKASMDLAMSIDGALAVALVDMRSGMCMAQAGGGLNLELAAAGNSEVVRAKLRTIEALGLRNAIEDILITLQQQYHLIRLMPANPGLFLYLALDRQRGNLALARYKLTEIERGLKV